MYDNFQTSFENDKSILYRQSCENPVSIDQHGQVRLG